MSIEPGPECMLCDRLVAFRQKNQATYPNFHNAPVKSFGPITAEVLIVGLAPGSKGPIGPDGRLPGIMPGICSTQLC